MLSEKGKEYFKDLYPEKYNRRNAVSLEFGWEKPIPSHRRFTYK